ncbi:MAG: NHL repeat-containing protein [Chloroflexota bacterium]|nr:hypothetical protein [Chloroflexota bacterium]
MKVSLKYLMVSGLLGLVFLLVACGGVDATNTSVPTTKIATTSPPTTTKIPSSPTASATSTRVPNPSPTASPSPIPLVGLPYLVVGTPSEGGSLREPRDATLDQEGNLYVVDNNTNKVVKFDKEGKFKNFVEPTTKTGSNSNANSGTPALVATDNSNNLYVVYNNEMVYKYDPNGKNLGQFGDQQLGTITSITSDKDGNIYTITSEEYLVKYQAGKVSDKYQAKMSGEKLNDGEFDQQANVRVDGKGNIYLFEQEDPARLQKFSPDFKFSNTYAIPKQADGRPYSLVDVIVDPNGNVIVFSSDHFWKFDEAGKLTSDSDITLDNPQRLLSVADGFILISRTPNATGKIDLKGKQQTTIGSSNGDLSGQFIGANSVVADGNSNFYVGDEQSHRIQKFDQSGKVIMTIDAKSSSVNFSPLYLALDKKGNLYAAGNSTVTKFDQSGKGGFSFGKEGTGEGEFQKISGLALDSADNIYVGDAEKGLIQKYTPTGALIEKYSIKEKEEDQLSLISLAIDSEDNLYIGRGNQNGGILVLDSKGQRKKPFGSKETALAELNIISLTINSKGTIYALVDSAEQPIAIIGKEGQISRPSSGSSKLPQFNSPVSLAADEDGNIYIAEDNNARVQRFHL